MGSLEGRIAVITGAGRGLGREHALLFAAEGARVVVNDPGGSSDGSGTDDVSVAEEVVAEILAAGGEAIADHEDVADWDGAGRLISGAIDHFGALDILVNNAGILRDRMFVNMSLAEWDDVIRVHMRGHFCPTRFAADYWRTCSKGGNPRAANVVNTSSSSGLIGNTGQANYAAAKAGIAALGVVLAEELARYGVRVNTIAPGARTRLLTQTFGEADSPFAAPTDENEFDYWHPANVSPLVAYLATADCAFTGATFFVKAGEVEVASGWHTTATVEKVGRWTVQELAAALPPAVARAAATQPHGPMVMEPGCSTS